MARAVVRSCGVRGHSIERHRGGAADGLFQPERCALHRVDPPSKRAARASTCGGNGSTRLDRGVAVCCGGCEPPRGRAAPRRRRGPRARERTGWARADGRGCRDAAESAHASQASRARAGGPRSGRRRTGGVAPRRPGQGRRDAARREGGVRRAAHRRRARHGGLVLPRGFRADRGADATATDHLAAAAPPRPVRRRPPVRRST